MMTNTVFANPHCLHSLLRSSMPKSMTRIEHMVALPSRHCIDPLWDPPFSPDLCSHFWNYWSERWSSCLRRSISLLRPIDSSVIPQQGAWRPGLKTPPDHRPQQTSSSSVVGPVLALPLQVHAENLLVLLGASVFHSVSLLP